MGTYLRATVDSVLRLSPAQRFHRWRTSHRLLVLAYHDVTDVDQFAWQMAMLCDELHPVSLEEVTVGIGLNRSLPRHAVLVTFDDGNRTVFENALPILKDFGVPAVVFVVAGLVGSETPFWWEEAQELLRRGGTASGLAAPSAGEAVRELKRMTNDERLAVLDELRRTGGDGPVRTRQLTPVELATMEVEGIAIGNHTLTHPCLDRCSDEVLRREIGQAHERLTEIMGTPPTAFAYPNGNFDPRARSILSDLGYEAAFLFDHRIAAFPPQERFQISRVRVSSTTGSDRFRILASGLHSSLHQLLGRS